MSTNLANKSQTQSALTTPGSLQSLSNFLQSDGAKKQIALALPKHITPDRMIRVVLTAAQKTPKLLQCSNNSIVLSLLNASQLGLEPNGRDAHLVPFWNSKAGCYECQLIADYKGLIQLAYRSGMVDNFSAKAVYEKDVFLYQFGTDEFLKHIPCTEDNPGELIYAWACVRFKNGGSKFVVLNRRDIARRRAKSQTANRSDSVWNEYPEAMWAKSAVRELSKWVPQTPEFMQFHEAVDADQTIDVQGVTIPTEPELPPPSKANNLAERMKAEKVQASNGESPVPESAKPSEPPSEPPTEPQTNLATTMADTYKTWIESLATDGKLTEAQISQVNTAIDSEQNITGAERLALRDLLNPYLPREKRTKKNGKLFDNTPRP